MTKIIKFSEKLRKSLKDVHRKHSTKLLILSISIAFIVIKLIIYCHLQYMKYDWNHITDYLDEGPHQKNDKEVIKILFWNNFFDSKYWAMEKEVQGEKYLKDMDCPVTNCIFSHNRKFLSSATDYDAVVFHVAEPFDVLDIPEKRSEDQIYIMANQESPVHTAHNLDRDKNFFNMTFTYRLDSDILFPYATIIDIKSGVVVAPSKNARWREPEQVTDPKMLHLVKSKTKMAAWFVSRCKSFSNRELLTKKLQKFINVDVYGKCGNLSCPRMNDENEKNKECTDMLNTTYKFYFSFENSICVDYITEKAFLNMDNYVIPILYNGITNMQHFLPPHSYIHVNDFNSIEELANYLKYLDKNPQEYANYFWWKKYYKINNNPYPNSYCQICLKLNEWDSKHKKQQYLDIAKWYNYKTCKHSKYSF